MAKFKKLPVVIEAEQFLGFDESHEDGGIVQSSGMKRESMSIMHCKKCDKAFSKHGRIPTLEGEHIACPGDFIIKGVAGEFYPCKPDIFDATYEAI